jgi:hypothetical protein
MYIQIPRLCSPGLAGSCRSCDKSSFQQNLAQNINARCSIRSSDVVKSQRQRHHCLGIFLAASFVSEVLRRINGKPDALDGIVGVVYEFHHPCAWELFDGPNIINPFLVIVPDRCQHSIFLDLQTKREKKSWPSRLIPLHAGRTPPGASPASATVRHGSKPRA